MRLKYAVPKRSRSRNTDTDKTKHLKSEREDPFSSIHEMGKATIEKDKTVIEEDTTSPDKDQFTELTRIVDGMPDIHSSVVSTSAISLSEMAVEEHVPDIITQV
jgi:hypothetical protein